MDNIVIDWQDAVLNSTEFCDFCGDEVYLLKVKTKTVSREFSVHITRLKYLCESCFTLLVE